MISSSPSQSLPSPFKVVDITGSTSITYFHRRTICVSLALVFQWFGMDHFLTDTLLCKARQGEPTSYYLADSERQDYYCTGDAIGVITMTVTVWWCQWVSSWRFNRPPSVLSSHEEPQRVRDGVMGSKEMAVVRYHDTGVDDWAISQAYCNTKLMIVSLRFVITTYYQSGQNTGHISL